MPNVANTADASLGAAASVLTTSTAPSQGQWNYYDASAGNLTPVLPVISGLGVGARYAVEKRGGTNTVTMTRAGSDLFADGTSTSVALTVDREQVIFCVVMVGANKRWQMHRPTGVGGGGGGGVSPNAPITPGTNTKVTYDSKGLVTGGAQATVDDLADGATYVKYSAIEKSKLVTVAINATANSSDAVLKDRANHTGTQLANTISDFNTQVDARVATATGVQVSAQTGTYTLALTDNTKAVEITDSTAPTSVAVGAPSNGGTSTTVDIPVVTGTTIRNGICVALYVEANPAVAVTGIPTGFAEADDSPVTVTAGTQSHQLHVYFKRQTAATGAGETTGNYTFTIAAGLTWRRGVAMRFQGVVREGDPWEVTANAAKTTTADGLSPTISDTSLRDHRLWVWIVGHYASGTSTTTATGFTEIVDTGDGLSAYVAEEAAAGPSGSLQATFSSNGAASAWLGALIPGLSVTVPKNATVPFPVGSYMNISQLGSSAVTLEGEDSSVDLRRSSSGTTRDQNSELTLRKRATDSWLVTGDTL